jgi:hypothetical protein
VLELLLTELPLSGQAFLRQHLLEAHQRGFIPDAKFSEALLQSQHYRVKLKWIAHNDLDLTIDARNSTELSQRIKELAPHKYNLARRECFCHPSPGDTTQPKQYPLVATAGVVINSYCQTTDPKEPIPKILFDLDL